MRIALVGCVKAKLDRAAPAKDLYTSPLFRGRRRWAEQHCDTWYIVSALHGLLSPEQTVAPYDVTLVGALVAAKRDWAALVLTQFRDAHPDGRGGIIELHAGGDYRSHGLEAGLAADGWEVINPAAGMGIGDQLAFYAAAR